MAETQAQELAPLRFVIPLDGNREEDRALAELFKEVSNGNLGAVARLLLQRGLTSCGDTVDTLLVTAMREQAARNRLRGRPRNGTPRARPVAQAPSERAISPGAAAEQYAEPGAPMVVKHGGQDEAVQVAQVSRMQDESHRESAVQAAPAPARIEAAVTPRAAAGSGGKRSVNVTGLMSWNS